MLDQVPRRKGWKLSHQPQHSIYVCSYLSSYTDRPHVPMYVLVGDILESSPSATVIVSFVAQNVHTIILAETQKLLIIFWLL